MNKNFGILILLGMAVGAIFGVSLGNAILGVALGALGGVFLGWFVAAAVQENEKNKGKQTMENKTESQKSVTSKNNTGMSIGIALGIALGAGIGAATQNIAVGAGVGLVLGISIGSALSQQRQDS